MDNIIAALVVLMVTAGVIVVALALAVYALPIVIGLWILATILEWIGKEMLKRKAEDSNPKV